MNPVVIVLGVIAIILIYVLYQYFSKTATVLSNSLNLNKSNSPILATTIKNPANYSCSYGVWIYVNSWPTNSSPSSPPQILFNRDANATAVSSNTDIALYLDPQSPALYTQYKNNAPIMITNNFPIQAWTFVIVSFSPTQFMDCYVNGKLVTSQQLSGTPVSPSSTNSINFGTGDIYLAGFQRTTAPMDPATAWSTYMMGNGQSSFGGLFSTYTMDITVKKNNVKQSSITF